MIEFIFITSLFAIAILAWATAIWVVLIRPLWRWCFLPAPKPREEYTLSPEYVSMAFREFVHDFKLTEEDVKEIESNEKFKLRLYRMFRWRGCTAAKRLIWQNVYQPFTSRMQQIIQSDSDNNYGLHDLCPALFHKLTTRQYDDPEFEPLTFEEFAHVFYMSEVDVARIASVASFRERIDLAIEIANADPEWPDRAYRRIEDERHHTGFYHLFTKTLWRTLATFPCEDSKVFIGEKIKNWWDRDVMPRGGPCFYSTGWVTPLADSVWT